MQEEKTNVMRFLEQKKVVYRPHWYACPDGAVDGISVAALLGKDAETVFKTLVTQGASKKYYVFVIPAQRELDLKAAAKAAGEKSIQMLRQAELLPLTGYVHGGCSPLGMKKQLTTFLDASAQGLASVTVSAGRIGAQVELDPESVDACRGALDGLGVPYVEGKTWTTDAFFRETRGKAARRREQGCVSVEMECASLAAVAQFRGVRFAQFFYATDTVDDGGWDSGILHEKGLGLEEVCFQAAVETGKRLAALDKSEK